MNINQFKQSKTLKRALQTPGWAILTATREVDGSWSSTKNRRANAWCKRVLAGLGYQTLLLGGVYKGVAQGPSFLVTNMDAKTALAFGRYFGQESVLVPAGLLYMNRTLNPVKPEETVIGAKAEAQPFYSRVLGSDSTPAFSLGIDFEKLIKL